MECCYTFFEILSKLHRFDQESFRCSLGVSEVKLLATCIFAFYKAFVSPWQCNHINLYVKYFSDVKKCCFIKSFHAQEKEKSLALSWCLISVQVMVIFILLETPANNNNSQAKVTQNWIWYCWSKFVFCQFFISYECVRKMSIGMKPERNGIYLVRNLCQTLSTWCLPSFVQIWAVVKADRLSLKFSHLVWIIIDFTV